MRQLPLILLFSLFNTALLSGEAAPLAVPELSVPHTAEPPVIDGLLGDACWSRAAVIEGLLPARGGTYQDKLDKRPTTVRLLWDKDNLYVSFTCKDEDVFATGTVAHDGNIYTEDACEVFIDAKGDGRQWIEIQVNPLNQTLDLMSFFSGDTKDVNANGRLVTSGTDFWSFRSWEAEGMRNASGRLVDGDGNIIGWTVEMAIPAKLLTKRWGGGDLRPLAMRANFVRYDHPRKEDGEREVLFMSWGVVEHGCPHISPTAMGRLILLPPAENK